MRQQQDINLIYKHQHPDYKGMRNGEPWILYYHHGTVSGPIEDMPEPQYSDYLKGAKMAQRREEGRKVCNECGTGFLDPHGELNTCPHCDSFNHEYDYSEL